jgi:hypothetical protein
MRVINTIVALLLTAATALLSLFYLGSQEQHDEAMAQHFWQQLSLRIIFYSVVGQVGAAFWWGVNWLLQKIGFVKGVNLRRTAYLLVASVIIGSVIGALAFCLA